MPRPSLRLHAAPAEPLSPRLDRLNVVGKILCVLVPLDEPTLAGVSEEESVREVVSRETMCRVAAPWLDMAAEPW